MSVPKGVESGAYNRLSNPFSWHPLLCFVPPPTPDPCPGPIPSLPPHVHPCLHPTHVVSPTLQDLLKLLEGTGVVVLTAPGAPNNIKKPLSILYKELGVPWLSSVVSVTPSWGLVEVGQGGWGWMGSWGWEV